MKNRTLLGIICIIFAVLVTAIIGPFFERQASGTVKTVVASENILKGSKLEKSNLKIIKVNKSALPKGAVTDIKNINGYAESNIYTGDVITAEKISKESNTAEDVFASLNGNKVAISFEIKNFAAGLSGKLRNGDIISLVVTDSENKKSEIPEELRYVKVITATTSSGIDSNNIKKKEDGTADAPATVTVLATLEQAKLISDCAKDKTVTAALVYRGDKKTADKFIEKQDEYLKKGT